MKPMRRFARRAALITLASLPIPARAVDITSTFNPGIWFLGPIASPEFTYTFTINNAEIAAAAAALPAGSLWMSADLALPAGTGISGSGPGGLGMDYSYTNPPPTLTLASDNPFGGFTAGDFATLTSSDYPSTLLGPHLPITPYNENNVAGKGFVADAGSLIIPGVSIPILASFGQTGGVDITGDATPGTYVFAFQDDNADSTGNIGLGYALVGDGGAFDISLARPLLANELISIGVSPALSYTPDGGQLVLQYVVPEPSTWAMMLVGFAGLAFTASRRRSRASTRS